MRFTLRARILALALVLAGAAGLGFATADVCWQPAGGYGRCTR